MSLHRGSAFPQCHERQISALPPPTSNQHTDAAMGYGQQAGGTYLTGKHTCDKKDYKVYFIIFQVDMTGKKPLLFQYRLLQRALLTLKLYELTCALVVTHKRKHFALIH